MWPNTRRRTAAASTPAGSRPPRRLGLFLSLLVILFTRLVGAEAFAAWGWRIPFLVSIVLLGISVWIRLQLEESPAFQQMKAEGTIPRRRLPKPSALEERQDARSSRCSASSPARGWSGTRASSTRCSSCGSVLKVDGFTSQLLVAWSLVLGTGGFVLFGWLSDKIGRKPIILGGCLIAALTYFPLFKLLSAEANPASPSAHETIQVRWSWTDPTNCSFQFNPTGTAPSPPPATSPRRRWPAPR